MIGDEHPSMIPDIDADQADERGTDAGSSNPSGVRDILVRLNAAPVNPVTRARLHVELEVPLARRGPGWDRHWRELEAYVESLAEWRSNDAD